MLRVLLGKENSYQLKHVRLLLFGGGNVLVWGCFAGTVVGDLVKIDGIMRKEQYLQILKNHAFSKIMILPHDSINYN